MRILFIRHGDPDYVNDTLTEKGHREAALLAEHIQSLHPGTCYVSPLGRAQKTAEYSLKRLGRAAQTLEWLREFPARIDLEQAAELREAYPGAEKQDGSYVPRIVWDVAPSYWSVHSDCMDSARWKESEICANSDTVKIYDRVVEEFDSFLAGKGYVRDGLCYRVEKENAETVTFFCHFGITCALPGPSVEFFSVFSVAGSGSGPHFGYGDRDRGTAAGDRCVPGIEAGRRISSQYGRGTRLFRGQVL